jgi:anti-sigma regulatory factor (Ser/Thr protein kinase)
VTHAVPHQQPAAVGGQSAGYLGRAASAAQWPLRGRAEFRNATGTSATARAFAAAFLARSRTAGARVSERTEYDVQLVVSELLANAAKYAPGPCRLDLEASEEAVEVVVWDTGTRLPTARAHDATRVGGHGLEIVMALSQSVGVDAYAGGKSVRARLALS